ncbi:putative transport protein [Actinobacillus pleuropneumoniae]|nr:putative transport protein [Actinobacillus pleuropneumoniae]
MRAVPILTVGFILICAYCLYAYRVAEPLLPLAMFKIRTFRIGILSNMLIRLSGSGIPFLLPLMLQVAFGYSADIAGWLMAPLALSSVLAKSFIGSVLEKLGYRNTLLINVLLMTCAIIGMSFLDAQSPLWLFILLVMWFRDLYVVYVYRSKYPNGVRFKRSIRQCRFNHDECGSASRYRNRIAVSAVILGIYRANIGETDVLLTQAFSYTFLTSAIFGLILALNISRLARQDGNHLHNKKA